MLKISDALYNKFKFRNQSTIFLACCSSLQMLHYLNGEAQKWQLDEVQQKQTSINNVSWS